MLSRYFKQHRGNNILSSPFVGDCFGLIGLFDRERPFRVLVNTCPPARGDNLPRSSFVGDLRSASSSSELDCRRTAALRERNGDIRPLLRSGLSTAFNDDDLLLPDSSSRFLLVFLRRGAEMYGVVIDFYRK